MQHKATNTYITFLFSGQPSSICLIKNKKKIQVNKKQESRSDLEIAASQN